MHAVLFAHVVERADVRVVQAADGLGFALEAFPALRVVCEVFGKDLDGYRAVQTSVGGSIHLAHTTCANLRRDFVWAKSGSFRERHTAPRYVLSYSRRAG